MCAEPPVSLLVHRERAGSKAGRSGSNAQWRNAPIAGYYRFPNTTAGTPEGVIDVRRPIKGDEFLKVRCPGLLTSAGSPNRVNLRVQLNIENLLDADKPLLRSVRTGSTVFPA